MSILDIDPPDPNTSWRDDKGELDSDISYALMKLLETKQSYNNDKDPLNSIYPNDNESHEKISFTELKARIPEMIERKAAGIPVIQSFSRMYNVIGRDHERITKLTKKCGLLSNQLFDLDQGQGDDLEWRLQDFIEKHEPDGKEIEKKMSEMKTRMAGLSEGQLRYAEEVAHHAQDAGMALNDLNLSLDKSHSMNVKERSAMYFVTGKLHELKKDLQKNLSSDNDLRVVVEKMKIRLDHVIAMNKKKLEKRRERRRKRKEAKLLRSLKDVNPQLVDIWQPPFFILFLLHSYRDMSIFSFFLK